MTSCAYLLEIIDPSCLVCRYPFTAHQIVQTTDWEQFIVEVANDIVNEQSPKRSITKPDLLSKESKEFMLCPLPTLVRACLVMRHF
jgi:hypothetical protein